MKKNYLTFLPTSTMFLVAFFIVSCDPFTHQYGYNSENLALNSIVVGKDTQETILDKLGSPSSSTIFPVSVKEGGSKWFYISKKTATKAFFKPTTLEQQTTVITFDKNNVVKDVKQIIGEAKVPIKEETTNTTGYETSIVRDIFGGFGKYGGKKADTKGS